MLDVSSDPPALVYTMSRGSRLLYGAITLVLLALAPGPAVSGQGIGLSALMLAAAGVSAAATLLTVRARAVFDASGIHYRGALRRVDLPWPDSRGALVVAENVSKVGTVAVAQYRAAGTARPVDLVPLRRLADTARAYAAVDDELERIWAWARGNGWVPVLAAADGPVGAAERGTGPRVSGEEPLPPFPAGDVDGAWLNRSRLVMPGSWTDRFWHVLAAVVIMGLLGGAVTALTAGRPWVAAGLVLIGVVIRASADGPLVGRVVIDREGFHFLPLLAPITGRGRHAPWPQSRRQLVEFVSYTGRRTRTEAALIDPEGRTWWLRIRGRSRQGRGPELDLVRTLDTIWAWGRLHGAAVETRVYVRARQPWIEVRRRAVRERIAYLRRCR